MYLIGRTLFDSEKKGLIAASLLQLDFLFFTHARMALLDVYVLAFALIGMAFYFKSLKSGGMAGMILSGIFFGLSTSSKLVGVLPLFICLIFGIVKFMKIRKRHIYVPLTTHLIIPLLIYLISYIPSYFTIGHDFIDFLGRQSLMLQSSIYLTTPHPYMSEPWTWPLMLHPLGSFYETVELNGVTHVETVFHLGNPLVWYGGIAAAALSLVHLLKRKSKYAFFLCLWFLSTWLFHFPMGIAHAYFGGGRAQYIFYFLQSIPPLCLMLANELGKLDEALIYPVSTIFLLAALLAFSTVYPVISGYPIPIEYMLGVRLLRIGS